MLIVRRIIVTAFISVLCISATSIAHAETSQNTLHSVEKKLQQNNEMIKNKEQEKETVNADIAKIQEEWDTLQKMISDNQKELTDLENKIAVTNEEIEKKRNEIVELEDKVLAREDLIKKRLVDLQENDRTNFIIETLLNSESIGDFISRIGAVSTLLNADNQIIVNQQKDLDKIEKDKAEITEQETVLKKNKEKLADSQEQLQINLKKKEETMNTLQTKYKDLQNDIKEAKKNKSTIQTQISDIQNKIKQEQAAVSKNVQTLRTEDSKETESVDVKGKEIYVSATAYSYEDTKNDVTKLGYDIKKNRNMKLIAVDPRVIPLGKKVWVEGYGVAIAADTGSAIVGHKIDVLKPSRKAALQWGRKTVKVVILD